MRVLITIVAVMLLIEASYSSQPEERNVPERLVEALDGCEYAAIAEKRQLELVVVKPLFGSVATGQVVAQYDEEITINGRRVEGYGVNRNESWRDLVIWNPGDDSLYYFRLEGEFVLIPRKNGLYHKVSLVELYNYIKDRMSEDQ